MAICLPSQQMLSGQADKPKAGGSNYWATGNTLPRKPRMHSRLHESCRQRHGSCCCGPVRFRRSCGGPAAADGKGRPRPDGADGNRQSRAEKAEQGSVRGSLRLACARSQDDARVLLMLAAGRLLEHELDPLDAITVQSGKRQTRGRTGLDSTISLNLVRLFFSRKRDPADVSARKSLLITASHASLAHSLFLLHTQPFSQSHNSKV